MITLISGTNRKDSMTLKVAQAYLGFFQEAGQTDVRLLSLENVNVYERNEALIKLEQELLIPAYKFVFIMPEYNGSFPGILKLLLDNSDIKQCWWYKKAMLTGVADGRGGNLRGLEHLTNILNYLRVNVHYNKIPLSKVKQEMDEQGRWLNPVTVEAVKNQINEFILF